MVDITGVSRIRLTMYVSPIEAGFIELLVHIGRYSTRSHALRAALGRFLRDQQRTLDGAINQHQVEVGLVHLSAERIRQADRIWVLGTAVIDDAAADVQLDELDELRVYGALVASKAVVRHLGDRLVQKAAALPVRWDD